jgi:hypothetical protein
MAHSLTPLPGAKTKRHRAKTPVQCFSKVWHGPLNLSARVTEYRDRFMAENPDLVKQVEKEKAEHREKGIAYIDPLHPLKFNAIVTELAFAEATPEQLAKAEDFHNSQFMAPEPADANAELVVLSDGSPPPTRDATPSLAVSRTAMAVAARLDPQSTPPIPKPKRVRKPKVKIVDEVTGLIPSIEAIRSMYVARQITVSCILMLSRSIQNLGNYLLDVFNIIEKSTGWKGFALLGGLDAPGCRYPGELNIV